MSFRIYRYYVYIYVSNIVTKSIWINQTRYINQYEKALDNAVQYETWCSVIEQSISFPLWAWKILCNLQSEAHKFGEYWASFEISRSHNLHPYILQSHSVGEILLRRKGHIRRDQENIIIRICSQRTSSERGNLLLFSSTTYYSFKLLLFLQLLSDTWILNSWMVFVEHNNEKTVDINRL